MKCYKGSISIYFVFCIVLIISVILSVTEIARYNCQKLYLQIATDAGLDSMISLYHRKLYEYYSIYGVEYRTKDLLTTEYLSYINPYFKDNDDNYISNWYIAKINEENINLDIRLLTDETYLEKEILEYMKFKIVGKVIDFLGNEIFVSEEKDMDKLLQSSKDIFNETTKSSLYSEIYNRYFDFAKDIKTLESYAKKLPSNIDKANRNISYSRGVSNSGTLSNGREVLNKLNDAIDAINTLKNTLNSYKNKMKQFREKVEKSKQKYESDKNSGKYEFSDEINDFVNSEFEQFISFVDENSVMNRAVDNKLTECNSLINVFNEYILNTNSYIAELESIEDEISDAKSQRGEDYDSEYVKDLNEEKKEIQSEFSDYIKELKEDLKEVKISDINVEVSTTNHSSEENLLDKLINYKNGILINLVLGSDEIGKINNAEINYNSFNILSENQNISLEKILLGEYELDKFNYYNKELNDEWTKSGSKSLEVERLICGKFSDIDNLKSTIDKILLIRIAMNVLCIYKSTEKRRAAREFAYTIFGGFSRLLAEVMFLVIISAWGTAQSIVDIKRLLKNHKVNFMHNDESWEVGVGSILDIANGSIMEGKDIDDEELALSYKDYLRLLLINTNQTDINARMVSIIERNIKNEQENFDFEKLVYSFSVNNTFMCKHFFTNFIFVKAKDIRLYDEYFIKTDGYKSYY